MGTTISICDSGLNCNVKPPYIRTTLYQVDTQALGDLDPMPPSCENITTFVNNIHFWYRPVSYMVTAHTCLCFGFVPAVYL